MKDFPSILSDHGFTADRYDFESTIIGFDYDIQFALFDRDSLFDFQHSRIFRQWNTLEALIRTDLKIKTGDIDSAVKFFLLRWMSELRYANPVREVIRLYQSPYATRIHVLSITSHNAITLLFNVT